MDEGMHISWRSALMAPVCFVIRSSVGGSKKNRPSERWRTDVQTEWTSSKERKKENKKRFGPN